jgi:tRNA dimethylallyltransferase
MQVYRSMDIGTAKPPAELRRALPHHLIDVVDPSSQFNAGEFVKSAQDLAACITRRGRIPVVSGGTAFYITSLLYGLPESPPSDPEARSKIRQVARGMEAGALHRMLKERDPQAAARIQPNDVYRISRALEILEQTGQSLFSFRWPRTLREDFRFLLIGLDRDRTDLYDRIDRRVDGMFADGLVGEVKNLLAMGYTAADPGLRGIGYREILSMRAGC